MGQRYRDRSSAASRLPVPVRRAKVSRTSPDRPTSSPPPVEKAATPASPTKGSRSAVAVPAGKERSRDRQAGSAAARRYR
jgi:hypothetical protein